MTALPNWVALLPAALTLIFAGISKNVALSLLIGILSGSLIASKLSMTAAVFFGIKKTIATILDPNTLILFIFLALLAVIIELMGKSGGVAAYVSLLRKRIKNPRHAEIAVSIFSFIFCIDDYINNMLTGAIIRPFADRFSIAREKIAFLLNSLSSPLVAIIPASTWGAMIITRIDDAGITDIASKNQIIDADPFITYLTAIPFSFYSIFIIITALYIVYRNISFGSMKQLETQAISRKNIPTETIIKNSRSDEEESLASFLIPLTSFLLLLPIFLLYLGNSKIFGGTNTLLQSLQNTNVMGSLCYTSAITSLILGAFLLFKKKISLKKLLLLTASSTWSMRNSFKTLTLAFTLGTIISKDLHVGTYIASLISGNIPLMTFPLIVFILSTLVTASTGSSWGTIALMMPLSVQAIAGLARHALPLSLGVTPLLYQTIGAILSGSVAGAHISPLTEATIISSISAGADHLLHVKTQTRYSIPALIGACIAFILASLSIFKGMILLPFSIATICGISVVILLLELQQYHAHKKLR